MNLQKLSPLRIKDTSQERHNSRERHSVGVESPTYESQKFEQGQLKRMVADLAHAGLPFAIHEETLHTDFSKGGALSPNSQAIEKYMSLLHQTGYFSG